ncbi:MAG: hypothetical protein ACYC9K_00010 [Sulfuricaulis sp.]
MKTNTADRKYRIEVLPYAQAPWAPMAQGTALRWAWRIVDETGRSRMVGSSNKSNHEVRGLAEAALIRMGKLNVGQPVKLNPILNRKSRNRAVNGASPRQALVPEVT